MLSPKQKLRNKESENTCKFIEDLHLIVGIFS
jgi:hypothetical protein